MYLKLPLSPYIMLQTDNIAWCKFCSLFLNIVKRGKGKETQNCQNSRFFLNFCHWMYLSSIFSNWFPRFNLSFSWNVMETLLTLVDKRTEGPLFLRRLKHCTVNTIKCVIWHSINKATVKIFKFTWSMAPMKDSFKESLRIADLKIFISNIFDYRYFFQTIGR